MGSARVVIAVIAGVAMAACNDPATGNTGGDDDDAATADTDATADDTSPAGDEAGTAGDAAQGGDAGGDGPTAGDPPTAGDEAGPGDPGGAPGDEVPPCPERPPFDYTCTTADPLSCPEGLCLFERCLAPILAPDRWADCGDALCGTCETAGGCPADCGLPPVFTGAKLYDGAQTLTVKVHGWSNISGAEVETTVYGAARGAGELGEQIRRFAPGIPDGELEPTAPNQLIAVEYFGAIPAPYLDAAAIAEIEALAWDTEEALPRYALIVAKFLRQRMSTSGATHVQILCHSMGCHVSRFLIEHDLEGLASENVIVRWATIAGVLGGAELARMYDNPTVRNVGGLLGLNTYDFIHMNPDYITDHSAVWDHQRHAANNPLFSGILIHNLVGTNPNISEGLGFPIALLDLSNPEHLPNDGLVFAKDAYFHQQDPLVQFATPGGERLGPTHSYQDIDHLTIRDHERAALLHAAALFNGRKVFLTLRDVTLLDDQEKDGPLDFSQSGNPPAELIVESDVRYDPYVLSTFGADLSVHEQRREDRTPDLRSLEEGVSVDIDYPVFAGPIFDAMTSLSLVIRIAEVDQYPRFGINESLLGDDSTLFSAVLDVPLVDGTLALESDAFSGTLEVRVVSLY